MLAWNHINSFTCTSNECITIDTLQTIELTHDMYTKKYHFYIKHDSILCIKEAPLQFAQRRN